MPLLLEDLLRRLRVPLCSALLMRSGQLLALARAVGLSSFGLPRYLVARRLALAVAWVLLLHLRRPLGIVTWRVHVATRVVWRLGLVMHV